MANTVNVQGDPYWAQATQNIAGLFNPKTAAQGSALLAQTKNYEAQAAHNQAKADLIADRRKALTTDALLKAGYTPRQVAAWQATQTDNMADAFKGIQIDTGTQMVVDGQRPIAGAILLGQGSATSNIADAIMKSRLAGLGPDDTFNAPMATSLVSDPKGIDGNLVTLTPQGWTLGGVTEAGKVLRNKIVTDTNESNAKVSLTNARATAVEDLAAKKGETEEARRQRIMNQLSIDDETAAAVIRSHDARTARTNAATGNDKAKADAAVKSTETRTAAAVESGKKDPKATALDTANKQATARKNIERNFDTIYAQRTNGGKDWALVDPAQKRSIVDYATQALDEFNGDMVAAMDAAEKAHNLTGGSTEGETGWIFKDKDGVLRLNGFKPAKYQKKSDSPVADAVKAGAAPTADAPVPKIKTDAKVAPAPAPAPVAKESVPAPTDPAEDISTKAYASDLDILPQELIEYATAAGINVKEYHDKIKADPAAWEAVKKASKKPRKSASSEAKPAAKGAEKPAEANVPANIPRLTDDAAGQAAYEKLPVGAVYVAPDGSVLTKK